MEKDYMDEKKGEKLVSFNVDLLDDGSYVCRKEYRYGEDSKGNNLSVSGYKTVKSSHKNKKELIDYIMKTM